MAGLIPEDVIQEVIAANDIVPVVEQYVRLSKKSAANFFGLCPFHSEDTPSFSVSPSKQIFYCFGCHKGGNVIRFIQEIEQCNYPKAIEILANRAGIKLPEPQDDAWKQRQAERKRQSALLLSAAKYFYEALQTQGQTAQHYLFKQRRLSPGIVRKFGLGYAPDAWNGLVKRLRQQGYADEEILAAGLARQTGQRHELIDLFRGRLMFPIFNVFGDLIAFGGRALGDVMPKYINSPETLLYNKSRHLFGMNFARRSRADCFLIVEGYFDCIMLHQAGIDYAAAALGTALTEQQAQLLRKYKDEVIIGFDADAAGQRATLRGLDLLQSKDLSVRVLSIPEGLDPDDYIRAHGGDQMKALIERASPLLDFKLEMIRRAHLKADGSLNLLGYQDEACDLLVREENSIVRELYAGKVADVLQTSSGSVLSEIERRRQLDRSAARGQSPAPGPSRPGQTEPKAADTPQATRYEVLLLVALAQMPDALSGIEPPLSAEDFTAGEVRTFAAGVIEPLQAGSLTFDQLSYQAEQLPGNGKLLAERLAGALMRSTGREGQRTQEEIARDALWHMRLDQLNRRKTELLDALKGSADDGTHAARLLEIREITSRIQDMRRLKE